MFEKLVQEKFYSKARSPKDLPWHRDEADGLLVQVVKKRARPGKALDLGCGSGVFSVYLAKQGYDVTGVDFIPRAIEMSKERAQAEKVSVKWVNADLLTWNNPEQYDLILDSGCLHSLIGANVAAYKRQVLSWLKPGGDYVLGHWGRRNLLDWRPIGPKRRSSAELKKLFAPELEVVELVEELMTGIPLPFGPTIQGVGLHFRKPAGSSSASKLH